MVVTMDGGKDYHIKLTGTTEEPYFCGKDVCETGYENLNLLNPKIKNIWISTSSKIFLGKYYLLMTVELLYRYLLLARISRLHRQHRYTIGR